MPDRRLSSWHADALYYLAILYFYGEGVPADLREALSFFRRAAELGHLEAMVNIGLILAGGAKLDHVADAVGSGGVGIDFTSAAAWFHRAANQGDSNAQWMLGRLYYDGSVGSNADVFEAAKVRRDRV